MGTCFVMQPFDGGPFDKRYEDVFSPAIKAAGLEPYRVDQDPAVSIPISQIETAIKASDICFAEITTNNPNVWFELGYAIATKRQVVLVCSSDRKEKYPFDVQHRSIIKYSTESPRDFDKLREEITSRLKSLIKKEEELGRLVDSSPIADVQGLTQIEMAALVCIAENADHSTGVVTSYTIQEDLGRFGLKKIATKIGVECLRRKSLVKEEEAFNNFGDSYYGWTLTSDGMDWLINNQDKLKLFSTPTQAVEGIGPPNDPIPF